MSDSQKQLDDRSRANELGERLMRRATEPLGVIDVSYAQRKYFRLADWLARRTALADHITGRYGVEDALATSGHPLTVQHTSVQARDPRPSSLAEIIAERSTKRTAEQEAQEASVEGKFRISRRPVPMSPQSEAASVPNTSRGLPDLALKKDTAEPSDAEKEGAVTTERAQEKQPAATVDSPSTQRQIDTDSTRDLPPPATVHQSPNDRVAMTPITIQARPDLILRKTGVEAGAVEKANAIQSTSTREQAASVQLRASSRQAYDESDPQNAAPRSTAGQPRLETGAGLTNQNSTQSDHRRLDRDQSAANPRMPALPLVRPPGPGLNAEPRLSSQSGIFAHPPQIDGAEPQEHNRSHPPSIADRGPDADRGAFVSPQIQEDLLSASMPPIVWRKQEVSSQIADYVAKELRASAIADSSVSTESASASTPAARRGAQIGAQSMPRPHDDQVRIEHISPQVIRTISERVIQTITLDLKLERERRGMPKWR